MNYDLFILAVNIAAIAIMIILAALLLIATRFKGENGYAAAIIVLTTVPVYLYNVCRSVQWYEAAICLAPFSFSINTTLMPLLWLFVKRNFDSSFRLRAIHLLHFVPFALSLATILIYLFTLAPAHRFDFMIVENGGSDSWIGTINSLVVFCQMFAYFTVIFIYLQRIRHYIATNDSNADYLGKKWIQTFMILMAVLFTIVFVAYTLFPRTDSWLIQILNVIAMSYLTCNSLSAANNPTGQTAVPTAANTSATTTAESVSNDEENQPRHETQSDDRAQIELYAKRVVEWLRETEAYTQSNLTLHDVAHATGISSKNLSRAINTVLGRNFFDLINSMRIEKAKPLLRNKIALNLTVDAIAAQCGFNSRATFSSAFKKCVGTNTSKWLSGGAKEPNEPKEL